MKSFTLTCLIRALKLYLVQKLLGKAKLARGCQNRKKLRKIGTDLFLIPLNICSKYVACLKDTPESGNN